MRKKQIIKLTFFSLLLVAVILSFSFYGCTKATTAETAAAETTKAIETTKAAETTTAETKVVEPITISLFTQAPGAYPQIFPEIIKNYEAKHPGVTVDMRVVGYGEYMASLATMIAAGEAPDVFLENQGGDLWGVAQSGAAMDLTSYLDANGSEWRNQMYSYIPDLLSWDGKVYGIAASLNNLQLLVNKGLLDEQKLTTPETTDDLIKMAKDLKNSGIAPIAFGTADLWTQIDLFTVFVHQQGGGAELRKADMGEIKWSGNPIFIKAMETIKQLNDAGVFLSGASAMNYHEDAFPVWMQGKTAMLWPGGNFMVQDITEDVKAEAIWFPTMPGGKKILTGGTALVWCASSTTKYPDLAVDLLKELTTQQTYGLMFENGVAPAGKLEKEVSSKYPLADKINKEQGDALDRFIYTPETNKEVAIAVQALMAGDVNASGAIDMIQKASDTAYKK